MKAELLWTEHISPASIRMRWRASVDALEFEPGQFYRFAFNGNGDGAFERSTPSLNTRTIARLGILTF